MEELNQFESEFLQEDSLSFNCDDIIFSQVPAKENIMNDFPSVCEIDTTEVVKKKLETSPLLNKGKNELCFEPESDDPFLIVDTTPSTNDTSLFTPLTSEIKDITDQKSDEQKETSSCTIEINSNFKNPVNYEKNQRFSKKYDKGEIFILTEIKINF